MPLFRAWGNPVNNLLKFGAEHILNEGYNIFTAASRLGEKKRAGTSPRKQVVRYLASPVYQGKKKPKQPTKTKQKTEKKVKAIEQLLLKTSRLL